MEDNHWEDQKRIPKGNGEESGRWTKDGGTSVKNTSNLESVIDIYSDDPQQDKLSAPIKKNVKSENFTDSQSAWANDLTPRGQTDLPDGIDKTAFVQRELGVSLERAQEYVDAIDAYADNIYSDIRAYQQGKEVEDKDKIAKISANLEEYIKRAPRWNGGETFRGVGLSNEDLNKYTVGAIHDMKGVSSWSSEPTIANEFADHYKENLGNAVIFHSPTQGKGTAVRHLVNQEVYGENEVTVSKESRYKVLKRETDKAGRIHVYLEEI